MREVKCLALANELDQRLELGPPAEHLTAVSAGGAATADVLFDDHDIDAGIAFLQLNGGPQAQKSATDDGDISPVAAVQSGPIGRAGIGLLEPEGAMRCGHNRIVAWVPARRPVRFNAKVGDTWHMTRVTVIAFALLACLLVAPVLAQAQDADTAAANAVAAPAIPDAPLPPMTSDPAFRPTKKLVHVARLVTRVGVYKKPGALNAVKVISPWIASTGNPVVLQIMERVVDPTGAGWLRVLLPSRPNGSTGWIREANTIVSTDPTRIVISLKRHTLTVFRKGRRIKQIGVALGAPSTPTPKGTFAIYQKVREPYYSPLGPWALHLTAHSNVLFEFAGGPGRVAIHGARGTLWATAGTNPSHGCIRVPDPKIAKLAPLVRPGTPVEIVA